MSIRDNSDQESAQQSNLTELIISKKWFIKANPGVKYCQGSNPVPPSSHSNELQRPLIGIFYWQYSKNTRKPHL